MTTAKNMASLTTYTCTDGNADVEIDAASPEDAAQEYVDDGDWGDGTPTTRWVLVYVSDPDDQVTRHRIEIEAQAPDCTRKAGHYWLDGDVRGHGGGVIVSETCPHCGCGRTIDTWAQDRATGEQGLERVTYEPGAVEPIDVPEGWQVYHREEAGCPELHDEGDWYYEPVDHHGGDVYSPGYNTPQEAAQECLSWVEAQETE